MIEAKELRRGNIVGRPFYNPHPITPSYEVATAVIHALPEHSARITELYRNEITKIDYADLQPIPLTQEWLHRFGGTMNQESGVWRFKWGQNGVVFVFLHQGYDQYAFELGNGFDKPVEFVHEFQNFFFALSNQELTLTP